jgi:hypothetical protein
LRVIKAAKAKSTNARGEAKLDPALVLGGALAVLLPVELVVVAVLEADPLVVLPVLVDEPEVMVEFEAAVADAEEEDPVVVEDPDAELEEAGPPLIAKRTL